MSRVCEHSDVKLDEPEQTGTLTPELLAKMRIDAELALRDEGYLIPFDANHTLAMLDELERLRAKCERYEKALNFYADKSEDAYCKATEHYEVDWGYVCGDGGKCAREALREQGGKDES